MRLCGCGTHVRHAVFPRAVAVARFAAVPGLLDGQGASHHTDGIQGIESDKQVILGAVLQGKTDERVAQVVAAALADAAVAKVRLPHRWFPLSEILLRPPPHTSEPAAGKSLRSWAVCYRPPCTCHSSQTALRDCMWCADGLLMGVFFYRTCALHLHCR